MSNRSNYLVIKLLAIAVSESDERGIEWLNDNIQELSPELRAKVINLGEALKDMEHQQKAEKAPDISEN